MINMISATKALHGLYRRVLFPATTMKAIFVSGLTLTLWASASAFLGEGKERIVIIRLISPFKLHDIKPFNSFFFMSQHLLAL